MSDIRLDGYWERQQEIVEDFKDWLKHDFTVADTIYQQMQMDNDLDARTFDRCEAAYKKHVKEHTEAESENLLMRQTMRV